MKKAFTLLELVVVIVVVGILAAAIIPRTESNLVAEAANKLVNDIRYTQHLAILNDKFDPTDSGWFKKRWNIIFNGNKYSIAHSTDGTTLSYAKDPYNNGKEIKNIELMGATVSLTGGCDSTTAITFDHIGRPITKAAISQTGVYVKADILRTDCTITLTGDNTVSIIVTPETGYVRVQH